MPNSVLENAPTTSSRTAFTHTKSETNDAAARLPARASRPSAASTDGITTSGTSARYRPRPASERHVQRATSTTSYVRQRSP